MQYLTDQGSTCVRLDQPSGAIHAGDVVEVPGLVARRLGQSIPPTPTAMVRVRVSPTTPLRQGCTQGSPRVRCTARHSDPALIQVLEHDVLKCPAPGASHGPFRMRDPTGFKVPHSPCLQTQSAQCLGLAVSGP